MAVALLVASSAVVLGSGRHAEMIQYQAALTYGKNPVQNGLNISFARVGYITQPPQYNTSGLVNASLTTGTGTWYNNTTQYGTAYGIAQLNSSSGATNTSAAWSVASYLGATVSYAYMHQRVALNGSAAAWELDLSQSKITTFLATTGSVASASATAAQNVVWVEAARLGSAYALTAYDWEYKTGTGGPYQNVTAYALAAAGNMLPLQFYDVAIYVQTTQTVVSVIDTATGAVLASSAAMHPVLAGNLSKLGYFEDTIHGNASSTNSAMILDKSYLLDRNTYTGITGGAASPRSAFSPAIEGAISDLGTAPTDPGAVSPAYNQATSSAQSWTDAHTSLSAYSSVTSSANAGSETSSLVNSSMILAANATGTSVAPSVALTMIRAEPENTVASTATSLYLSTWTGASVQNAVLSFLKTYVGQKIGVPSADVTIVGYLVSDVSVVSTFSSQAQKAVQDYLASQIPGYLKSSNLGLVNQATGAVDAGAAIGDFFDVSTHALFVPRVSSTGAIWDGVTGVWYPNVRAAGFPAGSIAFAGTGAIAVPGQQDFLGWTAQGTPIFAGGCFLVCLPGTLSGAAQAVSTYLQAADKSVTNAIGTVANVTSSDLIEPIAGTIGPDMTTFEADLAGGVQSILPVSGAINGSLSGAITGISTKTLGAVSSAIGSAGSATAGALSAGVTSFSNTIYHLGASAAGALAPTLNKTWNAAKTGLNVVENTVGAIVPDAKAVASAVYTTAGTVVNGLGTGTKSLLTAAAGVAPAVAGALNTVGTTLAATTTKITGAVATAWGSAASAMLSAAVSPLRALGGAVMSWVTGLLSPIGEILVWVIVAVVAIVVVGLLVLFFLMRKNKHRGGGHERGGHRGRHHRHTSG